MHQASNPAFAVEGVSMSFGAFRALNDVSLDVGHGEIRAIIGPNGAGKTTFVNIVSGIFKPTSGRVTLEGRDITTLSPQRRARLGLARTFQITSLFKGMTVSEHLQLAVRDADADGETRRELLEQMGLATFADREVDTLSHGDQRILEMAMAMVLKPKFLLLDEPTAGMSIAETDRMIRLIIERLRGRIGVIIIEHDMNVVTQTSDKVTVLAAGAVAASGLPQDVLRDPHVKEIYLGSAANH
ncbi:branched-chain amino acid ABC transporter substrate-binding protein [Aquamicrobium defluvii]|uniref:Branched-chain amino acid ABC transporter substrate-binding protein n=2 Tax=Aquamicrobium defluvii TaxID=69279 RepID=A0A011STE3_9HYPH|nr:branched-chain amino acid ABC transporter substrate-binding protein [Aquamicrobium defluvii]